MENNEKSYKLCKPSEFMTFELGAMKYAIELPKLEKF